MRKLMKKISIFTAIILCMMMVFAAYGTLVHIERPTPYDTQFFAMPFYSFSFSPIPSDSLSVPKGNLAVTWIREKAPFTDDNSVYKLSKCSLDYQLNYDLRFDLSFGKTNLYNLQKNASYYMRI